MAFDCAESGTSNCRAFILDLRSQAKAVISRSPDKETVSQGILADIDGIKALLDGDKSVNLTVPCVRGCYANIAKAFSHCRAEERHILKRNVTAMLDKLKGLLGDSS